MLKQICCSAVLVVCTIPLLAQSTPQTSSPPANPPANPPVQNRPARRGGESCWEQAGIEQSVMEQMHVIARDARTEVEAACSNSSLTQQQKNQQAREIREKAMQKREGLLTADQEKTLKACQQERRGGNHAGNGGMHEGGMHEGMGGRGCGEMPRGGSHPGAAPNGSGNSPASPPAPSQSSPQN